jgi:hypothetical protein
MTAAARSAHVLFVAAALGLLTLSAFHAGAAEPAPRQFWEVDEVRVGMQGHGRTVLKGTKTETFDAEVLGVLKNTSPGRDMVLCRLAGLNLDKTGVIRGMSGSPVYIDGKLLGAVAYAWPFGKEPIAGITPFCQMRAFVQAFEQQDLAEQSKTRRVGLSAPLKIEGKDYDRVTVSSEFTDPVPTSADGLWMVPLRTPLAATGFTAHSLSLLRDQCQAAGLVPMQGGAASRVTLEANKNVPLEPGGPLVVAMVTGDFDLSGIGTVTQIEGNRVYGFGHPMMGLGECEFPLMTGYIHTVYPSQNISFKMGSPLRTVGIINADVSTCIAGWLGRKPDMIPVRMTVRSYPGNLPKTFNVQVVRQKTLLSSLVFVSLTNSVDMQGDLPEEMTADLETKIEIEGHQPIVLKDTYSGASYSGGRAPQSLYFPVSTLLSIITNNSYQPLRVKSIECETRIQPGRTSAEIEAAQLDSDLYAPGDTVHATVFVRPYKGLRQRVALDLKLPADLPEGNYLATVCDDMTNARFKMRENPALLNPQSLDQLLDTLKVQTEVKRTKLVLRVPIPAGGVALDGKSLPDLPPSMVEILASSRRTGAQPITSALIAAQPTSWVVQGSEVVRFSVSKNKRTMDQ